jgi:hypothetical protein
MNKRSLEINSDLTKTKKQLVLQEAVCCASEVALLTLKLAELQTWQWQDRA